MEPIRAVKAVRFFYKSTQQSHELLETFRSMVNDAINIERRGKTACLGEVRPGARGRDEVMKGNGQPTAPILLAEAPKGGE